MTHLANALWSAATLAVALPLAGVWLLLRVASDVTGWAARRLDAAVMWLLAVGRW